MKPSLLNISKTMAFATAIGAASAAWATQYQGVLPGSTDFENIESWPDSFMTVPADATADIISETPNVASRPAHYNYAGTRTNVLEIETSADSPVFRKLKAGDSSAEGTIYVDMLVKPTAIFASDASPTVNADDKLLVYFKETSAGTTNLCVRAAYWNDPIIVDEFTLDTPLSVGALDKDKWYRLIIKAKYVETPETLPAFNIFLGGSGENYLCKKSGTQNADFISLKYASGALSEVAKVGFAGSGFVDDFVASDIDPDAAQTVSFDLTWPNGFTAVSYKLDDEAGVSLTGESSPFQINVTNGTSVAFTFTNADGVEKTLTVTAAEGTVEGINASTATFTWADYLGAAVDGAYEIDNLAELKLFQKGVAFGLATSGETFKQTADIALDAAWPGIGIQNGKDLASPPNGTPEANKPGMIAEFEAGAFHGTYDGGNFTISNFQMVGIDGNPASSTEGLDYCGFFNSTFNATIKDLKISYKENKFAVDTTAATKESGATFVGVAKASTLQNLTTVAGSVPDVSASKGFGGIVGYLAEGTTVNSCTNNINLTSLANNKVGGIAMICQKTGCSIANCQNNGTATTTSGEHGGIIGYTDTITISNCENTAARKMLYHHSGTVTMSGVNKGNATVISQTGTAVDGLSFATVDGNVATFVKNADLVAGGTYKLMATDATASVTLNNAGDTIAFDNALNTSWAATVTSGVEHYSVTSTTEDTVTTYSLAINQYTVSWTDHSGTVKEETLAYGATPTAPETAPVSYTENGDIYTGTWPTPATVTAAATYAAVYTSVPAKAMVISVADAGATTNEVGNYTTLAAAVAAAGNGDTVVLLANVNEAVVNSNANSFTIDLNGKTWSSDSDVLATTAGTITIEATNGGEMTTEAVECCAVWAKGGDVVINGGTFTSKDNKEATIYVSNANSVITINGGTFENTDTRPYAYGASLQALTLNVKNDLEGQHIIINGGTFIGNDPQLGDDTAGGTFAQSDVKFVSDGFVAIDDGNGNFVVQEGYNVTFDADGGTPVDAQRVAAGGKAEEPAPAPEKSGFTFGGWKLNNAAYDFDTVLSGDIELVAAWTAAAPQPAIPAWATDVTGDPTAIDQAVSDKYAAWATNVADGDTTGDRSAQFLMNVPVAAEVALTIDGIEVTSDGTIVTIGATKTIDGTTTPITLGTTDAGVDTPAINGILNVVVADSISELSRTTAKKAIPAANLVFVNGKAEVLIPATDGKFVKASVDYSTPASAITEVTE